MNGSPDRLDGMLAYVEAHPDQPFPRYGLAMELAKRDRLTEANDQFIELRRRHPGYLPAYYHHGLLLVRLERKAEARATWEEGVRLALEKGDLHAKGELEAVLEDLGPV